MMASMAAQLRQSGGGGNRVAPPGGAPFIAGGGGWQRRCELRAEQWRRPQSERGRHGWHRCSYRAADGWALVVSDFSNLSKTDSTLKIKMGVLSCSKISQFFVCF
jgi:hypothetical protein